jgi:hypothetical protein
MLCFYAVSSTLEISIAQHHKLWHPTGQTKYDFNLCNVIKISRTAGFGYKDKIQAIPKAQLFWRAFLAWKM